MTGGRAGACDDPSASAAGTKETAMLPVMAYPAGLLPTHRGGQSGPRRMRRAVSLPLGLDDGGELAVDERERHGQAVVDYHSLTRAGRDHQ